MWNRGGEWQRRGRAVKNGSLNGGELGIKAIVLVGAHLDIVGRNKSGLPGKLGLEPVRISLIVDDLKIGQKPLSNRAEYDMKTGSFERA